MKILIVCDQFPPSFGPRMGYLCKYLSGEGIEADVVCEAHPDTRFQFLAGYAEHVESVAFYRFEKGWKHTLEWILTMVADVLFSRKDRKMVRAVMRNRQMRRYDIVLCSTYRTFPLKAGFRLARKFSVPFVADLRDIIEQFPDKSYLSHKIPGGRFIGNFAGKTLTNRMLRQRNRILAKAMCVVSVSPWHVEFLKRFNPDTRLIENGYDPELFYPAPETDPFFRITFTGRLISLANRDPGLLFQAVSALARNERIRPEDFRMEWYVDAASRDLLEAEARKFSVEAFMDYRDFVPASAVPALLNRSSVLLQLANKSEGNGPKGVLTTKFFEALAVGKPILLVRSDESCLEALVHRYHCGLAARNSLEIEEFLLRQYACWKEKGFTSIEVDPEIPARFSRKGQAGKFAALFREIAGEEAVRPPDGNGRRKTSRGFPRGACRESSGKI